MTEREPYPSEKQDRFIVRLPDGMRDRIKAAAEAANRSMNAEIVATLEEKYPERSGNSFQLPELMKRVAYVQAAQSPEDQRERVDEVNAWLHSRDKGVSLELGGEPDEKGMQEIQFFIE